MNHSDLSGSREYFSPSGHFTRWKAIVTLIRLTEVNHATVPKKRGFGRYLRLGFTGVMRLNAKKGGLLMIEINFKGYLKCKSKAD